MARKLTERERTLNVQNRRLTERVAQLESDAEYYRYRVKSLEDEVNWLQSKLPAEEKYNAFAISFDGDALEGKNGDELFSREDVIKMAREDCYKTYKVDEYPYIDTLDDAIRYFEEHGYSVRKMRLCC